MCPGLPEMRRGRQRNRREHGMNQDDRRIRRTKRLLKDALAQLMTEKELRKITVQELADRADVHRATFYSHYHDVYDLYEEYENEVVEDLDGIIHNDPSHSYEEIYESMISYLLEHKDMVRMLFSDFNDNRSFMNRFAGKLEEKYISIWQYEDPGVQVTEKMRYLTAYQVYGNLAIISRWAKSGFRMPKDELLDLIRITEKSGDSFTA